MRLREAVGFSYGLALLRWVQLNQVSFDLQQVPAWWKLKTHPF